MPWLCVCFRAYRPYLAELELLVFLRRADRRSARPACLSIRQTRPIVRPGTTLVMNSFSPLTTYSSPSSSARGPQGGQVRAGAGLGQGEGRQAVRRWPAGARTAAFARRLPNVRTGSTAPMQPWTRGQAGDRVGSIMAIRVRNGAKRRERSARAAVFAIDQQAPVAGRAEFVEHVLAMLLSALVQQRAASRRAGGRRPASRPSPFARAAGSGPAADESVRSAVCASQTARWTGLLTV